jgi:hypothetical protein
MMNVNGEASRILLFLDCGALLRIKNCFLACLSRFRIKEAINFWKNLFRPNLKFSLGCHVRTILGGEPDKIGHW